MISFLMIRSVRQSVAVLWRQTGGETQNARLQVHARSHLQRDIHFQRSVGEDPRVFAGRSCHGL